MRNKYVRIPGGAMMIGFFAVFLMGEEPKPTDKNTITLEIGQSVNPQSFARPLKLFVDKCIDRSGNPKPMMMLERKGGVFLDREPSVIVREAVEASLNAAGIRAGEAGSADFILELYLFHFGLAESSGFETFGKVDLGCTVKNPRTGKSQNITAMGTSIGKGGANKKKLKEILEEALQDALRNLLRGTKLRDAIAGLDATPSS
jgi:hypothetical protein